MKSNLLCDVSRTRSYAWARKTTLIHKAKWIHGLWIFSFSSDFFLILWENLLSLVGPRCAATHENKLCADTKVNKTTLFLTCTRFTFETFAVSFWVISEWPFPNWSPGYHCHTWDQDSGHIRILSTSAANNTVSLNRLLLTLLIFYVAHQTAVL